ncbi:MAG: hypothetical protein J3K34DRAFT_191904 [Monoraphidium minutum]|nr:MAG: hypothetical protein J3K34DRAFT_191904 [Monoraphidium minutum]
MAGCVFACASKATLPIVALTFLTWAVALGGLGSLQAVCVEPYSNTGHLSGIRGFSPVPLNCTRLFSYYWFVIALQFIVVCGLALTIVGGRIKAMRLAWTGLLAVATVLCIQSSDSFLAVTEVQHYQSGLEQHTSRATAAGFIMTAILNFLLIFTVGAEGDAECAACHPAGKGQHAEERA